MQIARVALSSIPFSVDLPYSYQIPEALKERLLPGMRVVVPFGGGNKLKEGIVLSVTEEEPKGKVKDIRTLLDETPVLQEEGLQLALWMRERFFCTVHEAALTMLPTGLRYDLREGYAVCPGVDRGDVDACTARRLEARQIMDLVYANGGRATLEKIRAIPGLRDPRRILRELEQDGFLQRDTKAKRAVGDKTEKMVCLAMEPEAAMGAVASKRKSAALQRSVTELLCQLRRVSARELMYFTGATLSTLKSLQKKGVLRLEEREVLRRATPEVTGDPLPLSPLSDEQETVFQGLSARLESGRPQAALLYGVTGSGKTQVYLHLIQRVLEQGRGAIVMVPEIALTPHLLHLFFSHFGSRVAILHSCLSAGERYDEWKRVRDGEATVVVGTRSAVFAPLPDVGLIVLDEEQEGSYQSESQVHYHAREVAKYRCVRHGGLLLLGSATPAIESRYAAETGQYGLFRLTRRFNTQPLPPVYITDMKQELRAGNNSGLSRSLRAELEENFRRGEQSILFLNRRGNSRMAVCLDCGGVPACPRCSVHLTYHSANGRLMCHYCGYSEPLPAVCPQCFGRFQFVGMGTQKLQEELNRSYPDVEVLRMDADTVSASQSHEVLLERFRKKKIPILLGTQMVAKGLDFEHVTLVGVIDADLSLYADSYRASERTFSLLTQVVGRAGRGDKPGRAVLQTWTPDNDVITLAAKQDYDAFYASELRMRELLRFPPFTDLFRITASGPEESQVLRACAVLRRSLLPWETAQRKQGLEGQVLGPAPAGILKVNNRYRYRVLVKGRNEKTLRALLAQLLRTARQDPANRGISITIDVNPMN